MDRSARIQDRLGTTFKYASLVLIGLMVMLPVVIILLASFKTTAEFNRGAPFAPPGNWFNVDNFATALNQGGMLPAFANTTFILVISVVGSVLIGSMAAYAIDRFEFRMKALVLFLFLLAALVPTVTSQVATFKIINGLGLFNTRWSAIVLYMSTDIISLYIFLQFMRSIPKALDEAALLDGASHWTIYRRVILPLLKPAIVTVVIIKGVFIYNDFYIPFLYMPSRDLPVVATSLFRFRGPYETRWEVIAAGVIIAIIPTLVIFLVLQRWIYNGFARGAVK
jgi:ABC-type glycerol-3-phosphate transport system permease component